MLHRKYCKVAFSRKKALDLMCNTEKKGGGGVLYTFLIGVCREVLNLKP